jgi:hypothetical protein
MEWPVKDDGRNNSLALTLLYLYLISSILLYCFPIPSVVRRIIRLPSSFIYTSKHFPHPCSSAPFPIFYLYILSSFLSPYPINALSPSLRDPGYSLYVSLVVLFTKTSQLFAQDILFSSSRRFWRRLVDV